MTDALQGDGRHGPWWMLAIGLGDGYEKPESVRQRNKENEVPLSQVVGRRVATLAERALHDLPEVEDINLLPPAVKDMQESRTPVLRKMLSVIYSPSKSPTTAKPNNFDLDREKARNTTPRKGFLEAYAEYRNETSKQEKNVDEIQKAKTHMVYHAGRSLGRTLSHAQAHSRHVLPWMVLLLASRIRYKWTTWIVGTTVAGASFLHGTTPFRESLEAKWGGVIRPVVKGAGAVADIAERVRIVVNRNAHVLTGTAILAGMMAMIVPNISYIPVVSSINWTVTLISMISVGHYLGADGLSAMGPKPLKEKEQPQE